MVRRYFFNDSFSVESWHLVSTVPYVQCMVGFTSDCGRLHISRSDAIVAMVAFWHAEQSGDACFSWHYPYVSCYSIDLFQRSRQPVNLLLPAVIADMVRGRAHGSNMRAYEVISCIYLEFHQFVSTHSDSEVIQLIESAKSYLAKMGL